MIKSWCRFILGPDQEDSPGGPQTSAERLEKTYCVPGGSGWRLQWAKIELLCPVQESTGERFSYMAGRCYCWRNLWTITRTPVSNHWAAALTFFSLPALYEKSKTKWASCWKMYKSTWQRKTEEIKLHLPACYWATLEDREEIEKELKNNFRVLVITGYSNYWDKDLLSSEGDLKSHGMCTKFHGESELQ